MKLFRRVYKGEDGIGLTELTIAMAILLIGIFAVSTMLVSGMLHVRRAEQSTTAGVLAANAIEQIRAYEWRAIGLDQTKVAAVPDSRYAADSAHRGVAGDLADQRVALPECPGPTPCTEVAPHVETTGADGRLYLVHTYINWRDVTGGRLVKEVTVVTRDKDPGGENFARVTSSFDGVDPANANPPAPPTPSAPTIEPIGNRYTEQNDSASFLVDADDADGDPLTFSATGLPPGISIDTNQGDVFGTPTAEGTYNVTITVTDGTTPASASFIWTVIPAGTGPLNLALGKPAVDSSAGNNDPGPGAAVDGNTNCNRYGGSLSSTATEYQPWWRADLGASSAIGKVILYNRTDCCSSNLGNFYVMTSDSPLSDDLTTNLNSPDVRWFHVSASVGSSATINFDETGRYLQVQLADTNRLYLAEVRAFAAGT